MNYLKLNFSDESSKEAHTTKDYYFQYGWESSTNQYEKLFSDCVEIDSETYEKESDNLDKIYSDFSTGTLEQENVSTSSDWYDYLEINSPSHRKSPDVIVYEALLLHGFNPKSAIKFLLIQLEYIISTRDYFALYRIFDMFISNLENTPIRLHLALLTATLPFANEKEFEIRKDYFLRLKQFLSRKDQEKSKKLLRGLNGPEIKFFYHTKPV